MAYRPVHINIYINPIQSTYPHSTSPWLALLVEDNTRNYIATPFEPVHYPLSSLVHHPDTTRQTAHKSPYALISKHHLGKAMGRRGAAETEAAGGGAAAAVDEDAMADADADAAEAGVANGPGSADGDGNATRAQATP